MLKVKLSKSKCLNESSEELAEVRQLLSGEISVDALERVFQIYNNSEGFLKDYINKHLEDTKLSKDVQRNYLYTDGLPPGFYNNLLKTNSYLAGVVADRHDLSEDTLNKLVALNDTEVNFHLVTNPYDVIPVAIRKKLKVDPRFTLEKLRNADLVSYVLPSLKILMKQKGDPEALEELHYEIAGNDTAHSSLLVSLAKSKSPRVRQAVINNPSAPPRAIKIARERT